ncbi:MAG: PilZ domain-containing protein [Kofleriaceae bacterium]|nr:PilZ domain-containing protein [Kofleriaceae bacterium]
MPLAAWIRERLWRANDWVGELATLRKVVLGEANTHATAERILDIAWACELCDPDRSHALSLFIEAWRRGRSEAVPRMKALATALHAHVTLAELALAENDLLAAGAAFIDAGLFQLAIDPLQRYYDAGGSAIPKEDLKVLLALAKRSALDGGVVIKSILERARAATGPAAAALYVLAGRVARAAELRDQIVAIAAAALRQCPNDDEVASLIERALLEKGDPVEILAYYRERFERAPSKAAYVECVRAAGVELVGRDVQPGLGLRLLRMSLKHAYEAQVPEVTSHIAAWEMIVTHARSQNSTLELAPLIVEAMASPVGPDVAVYLTRLGLEIAWRDANDSSAAQPYAATLLDFVHDHPFAKAFEKEIAATLPPDEVKVTFAAQGPAAPGGPELDLAAPVPASTPVVAAAPTPAPAPNKPAAPRFVLGDEGPVKRAETPPSTGARFKVGGRLALLTPPPPRTTTLRRDTSPIPISTAPPPAKPTQRAPRKVVPIDVMVEMAGGSWFTTVLRDVSTSGAFILTKRPTELGALVSLELQLPTPGAITQVTHRTNAKIARRTDLGWGIAFVDCPAELVELLRTVTE